MTVPPTRQPGLHRAPSGRRRSAPKGKRRADVRPRYGRIAVLTAAATVSGIAVLGGFGLIPSGPENASASSSGLVTGLAKNDADRDSGSDGKAATRQRRTAVEQKAPRTRTAPTGGSTATLATTTASRPAALPPGSGAGRRIVFSESQQRVWLVGLSGEVTRTYLVSGSATDNLDPGTYQVFSRSRHAVGIDDSGTMEYFVRFTHGDAGAAIGFHTIPVDEGERVQTVAQLGTPLSHGCIRQRTPDAVALWEFAPIGTTVVVTD